VNINWWELSGEVGLEVKYRVAKKHYGLFYEALR
jgi:hypothetical protein